MNTIAEQDLFPVFERTIIALDVGRSGVKAIALYDGMKIPLVYPAIVARAVKLADEETMARIAHEIVTVDNADYFTGEAARLYTQAENNAGLTNDWTDGAEYKALVLGAISRFKHMGVRGLNDAYVVVGTPADHYLSGRAALEDSTSSVLKNAQVKSLSQPIGVYLSHVLDQKGSAILDKHRDSFGRRTSWIIIEVGHFDTGFTYIKEGAHQQDRDDIAEGISAAAKNLKCILQAKKIRRDMLECDEALRIGKILLFGKEQPITDEIVEAVEPVARKIIEKAEILFAREASKVNGILLAGGGSNAILHQLREKWSNTIALPEPRMSVAEGYLRYAISVMQKRLKEQNLNNATVVNG
ncbi:ParM/StbA family protein [Noviherbaspirillum sp. 1P10PC]|uniref:ParM/StbA family protein n=1 Tax=Noviherbaspirillum sp. 1P10PC TaxID=3132292 RepID=UPI0039A03330